VHKVLFNNTRILSNEPIILSQIYLQIFEFEGIEWFW